MTGPGPGPELDKNSDLRNWVDTCRWLTEIFKVEDKAQFPKSQ